MRAVRACLRASLLWALGLAGCAAHDPFERPTGCALEPRGELPVTLRHDVPLVQATVDGSAVTLILDTGAERTLLTDTAVARLGLRRDAARADRVVGIGANPETQDADARVFSVGAVSLRNRPIMVGAFTLAPAEQAVPDGLLGIDVLSHYDIDLNLPDGRVTLYRARDCPVWSPPWRARVAMLDANIGAHDQLQVPITLNGQSLQASIDTGSETTAIAVAALGRLGLSAGGVARDPLLRVNGLSRASTMVHVHRFSRLEVGDLIFRQPYIPVSPLPDFLGDALIGADILRLHRVWLSWASERVWIESER